MRTGSISVAASIAAIVALLGACSSSGTNGPASNGGNVSNGDDAGSVTHDSGGPPITTGDAGDAAVASGPSMLRVAQLSPDAPALDFCIGAPGGATLTGPVTGKSGLAFAQVTAYAPYAPGPTRVRVVAAGADCSASYGSAPDAITTLAPGSHVTVAIEGDDTPAGDDAALAPYVFVDDASGPSAQAALRFVHAAPGLPVIDVGTGTIAASSFTAMFDNVQFGTAATQADSKVGALDTDDYADLSPLNGVTLSAHSDGATADGPTAKQVTMPAGSVETLFLVGGKTNDTTHPPQLMLCDDVAATCKIVSS